ncbi:hypothetical protein ACFV2H_19685 [Streptomyces sp. NPDC059629]
MARLRKAARGGRGGYGTAGDQPSWPTAVATGKDVSGGVLGMLGQV